MGGAVGGGFGEALDVGRVPLHHPADGPPPRDGEDCAGPHAPARRWVDALAPAEVWSGSALAWGPFVDQPEGFATAVQRLSPQLHGSFNG